MLWGWWSPCVCIVYLHRTVWVRGGGWSTVCAALSGTPQTPPLCEMIWGWKKSTLARILCEVFRINFVRVEACAVSECAELWCAGLVQWAGRTGSGKFSCVQWCSGEREQIDINKPQNTTIFTVTTNDCPGFLVYEAGILDQECGVWAWGLQAVVSQKEVMFVSLQLGRRKRRVFSEKLANGRAYLDSIYFCLEHCWVTHLVISTLNMEALCAP
jgi:hypothetical protein